ncbi:MAG: Kelch motif protein [Methanoregula sp. PtaU1.Bin051]|nr:MAG: Kelch motif protein [Methanoregula sp. PtaU1.Bin051]
MERSKKASGWIPVFCLSVLIAAPLFISVASALPPVADFTGTPTTGSPPLTVAFTDTSTNLPAGWAWFFGDEDYSGFWARTADSVGWSGREYLTSVALPDDSIVIMGGDDPAAKNDVWRSTDRGVSWERQTPAAGWDERVGHSSVVLSDGTIVLMGGSHEGILLDEVWQSTNNGEFWGQNGFGGDWTPRTDHSTVVLPDDSILLMGGFDATGPTHDVWRSIDGGATWTEMTDPVLGADWGERGGQSSVVLSDGSIVLMGGFDSLGPTNDVWISTDNGATWTTQIGAAPWNPRYHHTSVVNSADQIILFGGDDGAGTRYNDVWMSSDKGQSWVRRTASAEWEGREGHTGVILSDDSILLIGGGMNNDVWRSTNSGMNWVVMTESAGWKERRDHITSLLPDGSIILMGGWDVWGNDFNDVWRSVNNGAVWTRVNKSAGWPPRHRHAGAVMPDGSIILMGGDAGGTLMHDVWISSNKGSTWTEQTSAAGWPGRAGHAGVALSDGSLVLMGGSDGGSLNDVWISTTNGATWTQQTAAPGWDPRAYHAAVALHDDSIVIMGGSNNGIRLNDVWISSDRGAGWTRQTAAAGWSARSVFAAVVMPDDSIVLFGGDDGALKTDVWRSTDRGVTWTQERADAGWLSARAYHSGVVTRNGNIVMTGGYDGATAYNDVWQLETFGSELRNPTHIYNTIGTYKVSLQSYNADGYDSERKTGYITVTAPAPPAPPAPDPGTSGSDSSSSDGAAPENPAPAPVQEPEQQRQQLAPPQEEPASSQERSAAEDPGEVSESYPIGFKGLSFNADNQNTLSVDLAAASDIGAVVSQYFNRVEVYQHGSPGVLITFYGSNFTVNDQKIIGKVDRAEFRTDPLTGNITEGNVTGSVRADLFALTTRAFINESIRQNVTADAQTAFRSAAARRDLDIREVAFTLGVIKAGSLQTGSANITMTIPSSWVERYGGREAIRIGRIPSNETESELIETRYLGTDQAGAMVFEGYSPKGTSLFGMLAIKAQQTKATPVPTGGEPSPEQKTAVTTITGMFGWIGTLLTGNLLVAIPVILLVTAFIVYTWRQKRQY